MGSPGVSESINWIIMSPTAALWTRPTFKFSSVRVSEIKGNDHQPKKL